MSSLDSLSMNLYDSPMVVKNPNISSFSTSNQQEIDNNSKAVVKDYNMVYCERLQQRESNSTLLPSQVNFQRNTDQWIEERKQCDEMTGRSSSYSSHDQSTSPPRTDPVTAAIFQREFSSYPTSDFRNGSYHLQEPDTNQEQMRNQQQMLVISKNKNQQAEDMMNSSTADAPPPDRNTLSSIICRAEEQQCNPLMVQITKMIHEVEGYLDDLHDIQIKNAVLMDDLVMAGANT